MKAYSMDLRERIVGACESGQSVSSVAEHFGVCTRTVRAYLARAKKGELAPRPLPGKAPRLRPDQEAAFVAMVQEKNDWTLGLLQQEWHSRSGVFLPRSTLHDHLQRLGGRDKKRFASPPSAAK